MKKIFLLVSLINCITLAAMFQGRAYRFVVPREALRHEIMNIEGREVDTFMLAPQVSMTVYAYGVEEDATLESLAQDSRQEVASLFMVEPSNPVFTHVANAAAYEWQFYALGLRYIQICTIHNNLFYAISYCAVPRLFDTYLQQALDIIASMRFVDVQESNSRSSS